MLTVALGADHAGWQLKEVLKAWLVGQGHHVLDFGTYSPEPVDYPDYAELVAGAVAGAEADRGVLVCGTGIGMTIAANKVRGVRAAACPDPEVARLSREHNDANVLALGGRLMSPETARATLEAWVTADFAAGRHSRRLEKIAGLERRLAEVAEGLRRGAA
jgi:ribose 5-phosphate isomerase B